MPDEWRPALGTWFEGETVHARVWAPGRRTVEVLLEQPGGPRRVSLEPRAGGYFEGVLEEAGAGVGYRIVPDDAGPFPDPASRFQPDGVHGSSEIIDPRSFRWTDDAWSPPAPEDLILYELHVGTFSPEGTFRGVQDRLRWLAELGVTAIELMPVADFPGRWNWGYDGVSLFAPARAYGRPDDLRALVDAAHASGIAVFLDVVYNHLGPDGAYLAAISSRVFTTRHRTPWGDAINFDGEGSAQLRSFFIENALMWVHEYHIDGLRLDATHAIVDDSPRHFLAEFAERVRAGAGRQVTLVAEDHRNLDTIVRPPAAGGWGFDGAWSDDFHHEVRRHLTGDSDGYFADFTGSAGDIATTVQRGWFFSGAFAGYFGAPRGTDPAGLPPHAFTIFTQNHDQVGNRAYGERLHHDVDDATWRAVSVLLLTAPEMPLLFMGQEWAASTPFRYFTDHNEELGRLVTEGRRREFSRFRAFSSPEVRDRIPDPQSPATFEASRLRWEEAAQGSHGATLRMYRALLQLRRREPLLHRADWTGFTARALDEETLLLQRRIDDQTLVVIVRLRGLGEVALPSEAMEDRSPEWTAVLTTEDPEFALDPRAIELRFGDERAVIRFTRPGAVILVRRGSGGSGGSG